MAGYEPFNYGQAINQWRKLVDWDNPPPGMMDIDWRLDFYKRNLEKWSAICADDAGLTRQFNIRQQRRPTEQIYRFILELLPVQDFFDFIMHELPAPPAILMQAVEKYDKDSYSKAIMEFSRPSIPKVRTDHMREMLKGLLNFAKAAAASAPTSDEERLRQLIDRFHDLKVEAAEMEERLRGQLSALENRETS